MNGLVEIGITIFCDPLLIVNVHGAVPVNARLIFVVSPLQIVIALALVMVTVGKVVIVTDTGVEVAEEHVPLVTTA